jgi:hypothetical protein
LECFPQNEDFLVEEIELLKSDAEADIYPYFDATDHMRINSVLESRGNNFSYRGKGCGYETVIMPKYMMSKNKKFWDLREHQEVGRNERWLDVISNEKSDFWHHY